MRGFKQSILRKKIDHELYQKNGIVTVDTSACNGCGSCIENCKHCAIEMITLTDEQIKKLPFKGLLKVKFKGANKAHINPDLCTSCGLCINQCHEFAIHKI